MSKYQNLSDYMSGLKVDYWRPSFCEIERILGFSLPASAYKYSAWWSNQSDKGHTQARAWQNVGWITEGLDLESMEVSFVKKN